MTQITPQLFDGQMARISATFGERNYRIDRIELIWNLAQMVWYEDFCKIVDHFISSFRNPPLPKDFSEAIRAEKRQYVPPPGAPVNMEYVNCLRCGDLGMIRVRGIYDNDDLVMRCDCVSEQEQSWKVPQWVPEYASLFRQSRCPLEWFKPVERTRVNSNIKHHPLAKAWRERIDSSEKYFESGMEKDQRED